MKNRSFAIEVATEILKPVTVESPIVFCGRNIILSFSNAFILFCCVHVFLPIRQIVLPKAKI
jgi:hypothetical protein